MAVAPFSIEANADRVVLCGDLDLATAPELERALDRLTGEVTLDCHQLEFIDSTGLSVLMRAHNRLATENGRLWIEVEYRVRKTNQVGNFVFPFYFNEGGANYGGQGGAM